MTHCTVERCLDPAHYILEGKTLCKRHFVEEYTKPALVPVEPTEDAPCLLPTDPWHATLVELAAKLNVSVFPGKLYQKDLEMLRDLATATKDQAERLRSHVVGIMAVLVRSDSHQDSIAADPAHVFHAAFEIDQDGTVGLDRVWTVNASVVGDTAARAATRTRFRNFVNDHATPVGFLRSKGLMCKSGSTVTVEMYESDGNYVVRGVTYNSNYE